MKQVVLGLFGTAIVVYTIVSCLAVYSISSRRNEMENCLAAVLKQNMKAGFIGQEAGRPYRDEEVAAFVKQDLLTRLQSDSGVTVSVFVCDMEKGILSAGITEQFFLPNGIKKTLGCSKTLVAVPEAPSGEELNEPVRLRFISKKYFEDAAGRLVDQSHGGLDASSRWASDPAFRSLLRQTLEQAEPL